MKNRFTKTSNPIFKSDAFDSVFAAADSPTMTVAGTVNKTLIMTFLVLASAIYTWTNPSSMFLWVGLIGGLIAALVTSFKPTSAPVSAPIYALFEGMFLGTLSVQFATLYNGIVFQAITLTIGTLFAMLFLYKTGIVKVTAKFRMGVMAATGGIALFYLINFVMSFFNMAFFTIEGASLLTIGISLAIVVVAALNLVLDFDFIDRAANANAPKYMEWYASFGLMVTLIWLYIELLRLLAMLSSRD